MEEQARRPVGSIAFTYNGRASYFLIGVLRQPLLQAEQKRWGDVAATLKVATVATSSY